MPSTHTLQSSKGSFQATYYGEFVPVSNKKCYFLLIRSHFKVEKQPLVDKAGFFAAYSDVKRLRRMCVGELRQR